MDLFDAVCHAITSLFTAGFSTRDTGMIFYNSNAINIFALILMILGSINTGVLLMLFQGKFKIVKKITEIRFMFIIIILFGTISTFTIWFSSTDGLIKSMLCGFYNIINSLSTTGSYYCCIKIFIHLY